MQAKTTNNIKVSAEVFYQTGYSNPLQREFMFAYRITIKNDNPFPVKLLWRKWIVFDASSGDKLREIEGEGVVGMTPVIPPHNEYQYVSGCNLHSEVGNMRGHYTVQEYDSERKAVTGDAFQVATPRMNFYYPPLLN